NTTKAVLDNILQSMAAEIPRTVNIRQLIKEILDEALALGPLEELLADDEVTEIMVNNWDTIYVERGGKIQLSDSTFTDNDQVVQIIRRILAPLGRRIDESSPLVDARLKDGSRVNAVIPPLAVSGPTLTIRKFPKERLRIEHLIQFGSLTQQMAQFLDICVKSRKNIVISGGTGSGKTTLLNVISSFIPSDERIVTIEDVSELQLPQDHVVRLESRPPNLEGKGAIGIRELVINSLRMRPDRIVVGECRGGEALDMLQAMNTGHDGSLTTLHANSPRDAIARLETMVLMAGMDLPAKAIREQIASAVDIVVQQTRLSDGSRKVMKISEIVGMEGTVVTMQDIFVFEQTGYDHNGKVQGYHRATGTIPKFIQELRKRGIAIDMSIFAT
ncbi:MAG: CpaF family protein, partial [Planctomycetota bacterium]